jgi:putative transposase
MKAPTSEINYHIVFCTKYRKPLLTGKVEDRLRELLVDSSDDYGFSIKQLEIMPDHVHVFVQLNDTEVSPHRTVSRLKGYSSRFLRKEFDELRKKIPCMWTRAYYIGSVGHVSKETILKYIENQKNV